MPSDKVKHCKPSIYACYYAILKEVAYEHGYALALHGSLIRDLDLIAVPWVDKPKSAISMLRAFGDKLGSVYKGKKPYATKAKKSHGRVAYTIPSGIGYLDISVLSRTRRK